jgi:hypothetical protein
VRKKKRVAKNEEKTKRRTNSGKMIQKGRKKMNT